MCSQGVNLQLPTVVSAVNTSICGLRLQTANVSYICNFRETHNAYASVSHEAALDAREPITNPVVHDALSDHLQHNLLCVEACGGTGFFRVDCGVAAGSCLGNRLLHLAVWPAKRVWHFERTQVGVAKHLNMPSPIIGTIVNPGSTIYADDCGSFVTGDSVGQAILNDKK